MSTNPGLVIGIASSGRPVTLEWALSIATQNYPLSVNLTYFTLKGKEVGEARNLIVDNALNTGAKYLWFVDDDTAPPNFAVRKLLYELNQNPEAMVAGGIYCTKSEPPEPIVYQVPGQGAFWQWKVGEVFECSGLGTGCMMIKTEVFKHLEKPYFKTVDEAEPVEGRFKTQQTDDLYFCDKVLAAGFKILAHGGVLPIHWDVNTGNGYTLPLSSYPVKDWVAKKQAT